jgi:ankyrin repeat protein
LHYACQRGACSAATWLLQQQVPASKADLNGTTPILMAISGGHTECITLLELEGASIQESDKCNRTAMHYAVQGNQCDSLAHYARENSAIDSADCNGITPLMVAVSNCNLYVCKRNSAPVTL